jgi:hypothetical protein
MSGIAINIQSGNAKKSSRTAINIQSGNLKKAHV